MNIRKPETSLADPWPAPCMLPKLTQQDDCGDYESELAVIIGKECKNVSEQDAYDYVLGYTVSNDISSRSSQFAQSQWCFSKGFDGACPLGKWFLRLTYQSSIIALLLSTLSRPSSGFSSTNSRPPEASCKGFEEWRNLAGLWYRVRLIEIIPLFALSFGLLIIPPMHSDLIFSIPRLISFLSQSTTLKPGTVIITGTPAGVGIARKPKVTVKEGDEFIVEILPHIGSLITKFENEV